jgi:hypothetical protein
MERIMPNDENDPSVLDGAVAKMLTTNYGQLTRRGFLSHVTRQLLNLAGVSVAAQVFPYFISDAEAVPGNQCGLHGRTCRAGTLCATGLPNTAAQAAWVQCCKVEKCNTDYRCCTYTDWCGLRPAGWPDGCDPHINNATGTSSWCTMGEYVCTQTSCSATYGSLKTCTDNCSGSSCAT